MEGLNFVYSDENKAHLTGEIISKYRTRLSVLRKAHEYSRKDDLPNMVMAYQEYLRVLSRFYNIDETDLEPSFFLESKNLAEVFLISHVYWDLAKAYDRSVKMREYSIFYLSKFSKFTIGFKYQFINSEMVRKFIEQKKVFNHELFENTYKQIRLNSNHCYIATYCFNDHHSVTKTLRLFKSKIMKYKLGDLFVEYYYRFSPPFVKKCKTNHFLGFYCKNIIFRPSLKFFAFICEKFII
mgnify:FL=1